MNNDKSIVRAFLQKIFGNGGQALLNIITMKHIINSLVRMFQNALMVQPDGRLLRRSLINYVLAIGGSYALVIIAYGVAIMAGIPAEALETPGVKINLWDFIGAVVFAPVVETLLLAGLLALITRRWGIVPKAIISAMIWGGLHAIAAPFWFFGTVFGFFVFSCSYMVWRQKSFACGFAAAALPHALINLSAFVLTAIFD